MSNKAIIDKWVYHSHQNLKNFSLLDVYSIKFIGDFETADDFFSIYNINVKDVVKSKSAKVNFHLKEIDSLMLETTSVLREFIIEFVLSDDFISDSDVLRSYFLCDEKIRRIYSQIILLLHSIKYEIDNDKY